MSGGMAGKTVTSFDMHSNIGDSYGNKPGGAPRCAVASGSAYCWTTYYNTTLGLRDTVPALVGGSLAGKTVTAVQVDQYWSATSSNGGGVGEGCALAEGQLYCFTIQQGAYISGYNGYDNVYATSVSSPSVMSGGMAGKTVGAAQPANSQDLFYTY
jgi:hypothetical protein